MTKCVVCEEREIEVQLVLFPTTQRNKHLLPDADFVVLPLCKECAFGRPQLVCAKVEADLMARTVCMN